MFEMTESMKLVQQTLSDFAIRRIRPEFMIWDEAQTFPTHIFHELGELGFAGIIFPEKYGGAGMGYMEYVTAIAELSKVDGSIGISIAAHNSLCANHIYLNSTEEQKEKWLIPLAQGKKIGAWGLTEPHSGSDAGGLKTTGILEGDHYIVNGSKQFITHSHSADIFVVLVNTNPSKGTKGVTALVIEKGIPGFSHGKKENKLGLRASETGELIFNNVKVPVANRLGSEGDGFAQAMKVLDGGRISIAALALGMAEGAYEACLKYVHERKAFGKAIKDFQAIQFKLADMKTEIEAARLLIYQAASLKDQGKTTTLESAMCKLYASEVSVRVANEAVQIFGGYGYVKDFPVEKFYRDVKLCTIGEGTSEIQRIVIARKLLESK
ncbi:MAG: acyl-CoA dehydrogenase family protein [Bacteroidetes bacterium]|nr:acyl-CoA dehydrogenase family protein [Bacteroidota bacterium]